MNKTFAQIIKFHLLNRYLSSLYDILYGLFKKIIFFITILKNCGRISIIFFKYYDSTISIL